MIVKVFESFAGYGSQALALKRLAKIYPPLKFEFVGISEIDKNAIAAYHAIHGDVKNYGDISKIDWNEVPDFDLFTYSFPCFVAGTLIHTERGIIPIEEVKEGDMVITHTNAYQKVLRVGSREGADVVRIKGSCIDEIVCTPNHPFYVRKKYRYGHFRKRAFTAPEWVYAKDLVKGWYLGCAINQKAEIPEWNGSPDNRPGVRPNINKIGHLMDNPDFWYIIGRYIGDGWVRKSKLSRGIVIACSCRNKDKLEIVLKSIGLHYTMVRERTVYKCHIVLKELCDFVQRYGKYAHGKYIDEGTINLPVPLLRWFLEGVIDSDGCYTEGEFKVSTTSRSLLYGLQQCIMKVFHCPAKMTYFKRKPTCVIEGRTVNQRDTYTLIWHSDKRKQDKAFYEDGYVWYPFNCIEQVEGEHTVYNMEVENDNSYTANGTIVHNCQDISNAGLQRGFAEGSNTRSSLLWECREAIEIKRPKFLMMENVKALTQKKFMPFFKSWCDELKRYGYCNFWQVLNAKNYDVPQNRERVFMISIRDDGDNPSYTFPEPITLSKRLKDILEKEVDESFYLRQEQVQRIVAHCERKVAEGCGFKTNFQDENGVSGAIKTKEGSREYDTYVKCRSDDERPAECSDSVKKKVVTGLNQYENGTARTVKATYCKTSAANFEKTGSYGATGVIEASTPPRFGNSRLNKMCEDGKIDTKRTEWVDDYNQITNGDVSGTITTRISSANHYFISEQTDEYR